MKVRVKKQMVKQLTGLAEEFISLRKTGKLPAKATQKKRGGRPRLPRREVKTRTLLIRVTAREWRAVARASKTSKQPLSAWVRAALADYRAASLN